MKDALLQVSHFILNTTHRLTSSQGVDLKSYSKQIESQLSDVERASVADCILIGWFIVPYFEHTPYFNSREEFIKLRDQMFHVDEVLGNFEDLLTVFQNDLKSISSEMRSLQNESMTMDIKLKNRKVSDGSIA